ncbi:MAG: transposase [Patescibacteria group bacterium]
MPGRSTILVNEEYYHIFNRGVARQPTFLNRNDYKRALLTLSYYRFTSQTVRLSRFKEFSQEERNRIVANMQKKEKFAEIVSFVFMPNHFHLLLKQTIDNGISHFLSKFTNSYTKYFNTKYNRVGPVFQGVFKSVHIDSDEQLLHLSRYIHLNPVVSVVVEKQNLLSYPWSSFPEFLTEQSDLIFRGPVLEHFQTADHYKKFVFDNIDYGRKLEEIKHLVLE